VGGYTDGVVGVGGVERAGYESWVEESLVEILVIHIEIYHFGTMDSC